MESTKTFQAKSENSKGITIELYSEICHSWGYGGKKRAIEEIANALSDAGYDVSFKAVAIKNIIGIYNLFVVKKDGTKVVVYSNNAKDKGAVIHYSPSYKAKEIIENILSVLWWI